MLLKCGHLFQSGEGKIVVLDRYFFPFIFLEQNVEEK